MRRGVLQRVGLRASRNRHRRKHATCLRHCTRRQSPENGNADSWVPLLQSRSTQNHHRESSDPTEIYCRPIYRPNQAATRVGRWKKRRSTAPIWFFFGSHEHASRYRYYSKRQYKYDLKNYSHQHNARFDSALWPPTDKATLIAEGIVVTPTGEREPFRQVSVWGMERDKGFRKVSMP